MESAAFNPSLTPFHAAWVAALTHHVRDLTQVRVCKIQYGCWCRVMLFGAVLVGLVNGWACTTEDSMWAIWSHLMCMSDAYVSYHV